MVMLFELVELVIDIGLGVWRRRGKVGHKGVEIVDVEEKTENVVRCLVRQA